MEKLSKEELLKVLAKAVTPTKTRKKAERNEEQQKELTERLSRMREKSLEIRLNRRIEKETAKADSPVAKALDLAKGNMVIAPAEDIFEKKYGSTLERITEVLSRVDNNMTDMKEMKKLKAEARRIEKEDLVKKAPPKIEEFNPTSPQMADTLVQPLHPSPWATTQVIMKAPVVPMTEGKQPYKFGDFNKMNFGKKK